MVAVVSYTNAKVTYEVEFTRNLGNYENVKPKFGISADIVYENEEELEEIKKSLTDRVDQWLTDKVEELEAELKELGLGKQ